MFNIGAQQYAAANPFLTYAFNGLLNQVQVYNKALTAEQVKAIYTAGSSGLCQ